MKVRHLLFSGSTELLAVRQRCIRRLQSFCAVHPDPVRSFGAAFLSGPFLFSTIAYQLALKVPGLRQHFDHIMDLDPTLQTKSIDVQLQTLFVDALQYRRIGWQRDTTDDSSTLVLSDHNSLIIAPIYSWESS